MPSAADPLVRMDARRGVETTDDFKGLLVPCPDAALKLWPVNRQRIGNVRNKTPEQHPSLA
jgi:hypothetical protein